MPATPARRNEENDMADRNDIINQIQGMLGSEGSREIADHVFDVLRSDDRIAYDDIRGLFIREGVDLIGVAAELS